jgi:hypothetical protein
MARFARIATFAICTDTISHFIAAMTESPSKRRKITQLIEGDLNEEDEEEGEGSDESDVALTRTLPTPLCERPIPTSMTTTTEHASAKPLVLEPDAYLRPHEECFSHGKEKEPWKRDFPDDTCCARSPQARHSGRSDVLFRLHSLDDPLGTLKRWLSNRNEDLMGQTIDRGVSMRYLLVGASNSRASLDASPYKPQHLRQAIQFAIEELALCHAHIEGMRSYLTRAPYLYWYSNGGPLERATPSHVWPLEEDTARLGMDWLEPWMVKLALELDYLKYREATMWQDILDQKWWEAKDGNMGEIEELLRLGFVDKNMVGEYCGVPNV